MHELKTGFRAYGQTLQYTALCLCREAIDYLANTLIFVVSGIIIAGKIYQGHQESSPYILTGTDYGWAVVLWLLLLVRYCCYCW